MAISVKITWDGNVPGLDEHKLSVGQFGDALRLLVDAFRRTASSIIADAVDNPTYAKRGGKYRKDALRLDLAIAAIEKGSTAVAMDCLVTPPSPGSNLSLWDDLPRAAADRLLLDVEQEARGVLRNSYARKFIRSIPAGVTKQSYALYDGDELVRHVQFGHAHVADDAATMGLGVLRRLDGEVVGVGFEPGKGRVELKIAGKVILCSATEAQVDAALRLRHQAVQAMSVDKQGSIRLLWLRAASDPFVVPSPARRLELTENRWRKTLEILSR